MARRIIAFTLMGLTSFAGCHTPSGTAQQPMAEPPRSVTGMPEPAYYICYTDDRAVLALSIGFDNGGTAILAKHKDHPDSIALQAGEKQEYLQGGAHPTISDFYKEVIDGQVHGSYKLTHSGVWDYASYTPVGGGEEVRFSIDHDTAIQDGGYRTSVCF